MTKQTNIGPRNAVVNTIKMIFKRIESSTDLGAATMPRFLLPTLTMVALLATALSAELPAVPDFSKGMPEMNLERKEVIDGTETFHLKTPLNSKEFSAVLSKFLGAGWGKRKLSQEEMILAATRGRASNGEVSLAVYENPKVPGIEIQVIHLKRKEANPGPNVEISVIQRAKD